MKKLNSAMYISLFLATISFAQTAQDFLKSGNDLYKNILHGTKRDNSCIISILEFQRY